MKIAINSGGYGKLSDGIRRFAIRQRARRSRSTGSLSCSS